MSHSLKNSVSKLFLVTIAALTTSAIPTLVQAQSSSLVITPSQAEAVKGAVAYGEVDSMIDGKDIRELDIDLEADIDTPADEYRDENFPVVELDRRDNTDFTIGAIPLNEEDGKGYRDPYSVENIEMDPLYPEGRYVDTMRASAGLDLSSEF